MGGEENKRQGSVSKPGSMFQMSYDFSATKLQESGTHPCFLVYSPTYRKCQVSVGVTGDKTMIISFPTQDPDPP